MLLDRDRPETVDAVLIDHRAGVRTAILRLLDFGHRRIAMLTGQEGVRPGRERIVGYREAFASRAPETVGGVHTLRFIHSGICL